ncbi:hypothetical protein [Acidianus brierleyi]|uniref:Phosphoesterase n=1 Tax=Acidianus brierleyi TaxID=41673 RepID=A0A2U9IGG5_9CREN|nr:hypothetical protein [Acidianus brierleyi]AWR95123.1 hypothetical protein DFR85_11465 [Acidianus brierleyi]
MGKIYCVISRIFHPSITSAVGFSAIAMAFQLRLSVIILFLIFYGIMPYIMVYFLKIKGKVSNIFVTERKERPLMFALTYPLYLIVPFLLYLDNTRNIVTYLSICYAFNTLLLAIITLKFKISLHESSIAGIVSAVIYIFGFTYVFLLFLPLIVGISRIKLKQHTLAQVFFAFVFITFLTVTELYLYYNIL